MVSNKGHGKRFYKVGYWIFMNVFFHLGYSPPQPFKYLRPWLYTFMNVVNNKRKGMHQFNKENLDSTRSDS